MKKQSEVKNIYIKKLKKVLQLVKGLEQSLASFLCDLDFMYINMGT